MLRALVGLSWTQVRSLDKPLGRLYRRTRSSVISNCQAPRLLHPVWHKLVLQKQPLASNKYISLASGNIQEDFTQKEVRISAPGL